MDSKQLLVAAKLNNPNLVFEILARKAQQIELISDNDLQSKGWNAIHWAAFHTNLPMLEHLIHIFPHSINDKTGKGYFKGEETPLHIVVYRSKKVLVQKKAVIEFLRKKGADDKVKCQRGYTAIGDFKITEAVTVYYWPPVKEKEVGHMALSIESKEFYFSFWPASATCHNSDGCSIRSHVHTWSNRYVDFESHYKEKEPKILKFYSIDTENLIKQLNELKRDIDSGSATWNANPAFLLGLPGAILRIITGKKYLGNCNYTTYHALYEHGAYRLQQEVERWSLLKWAGLFVCAYGLGVLYKTHKENLWGAGLLLTNNFLYEYIFRKERNSLEDPYKDWLISASLRTLMISMLISNGPHNKLVNAALDGINRIEYHYYKQTIIDFLEKLNIFGYFIDEKRLESTRTKKIIKKVLSFIFYLFYSFTSDKILIVYSKYILPKLLSVTVNSAESGILRYMLIGVAERFSIATMMGEKKDNNGAIFSKFSTRLVLQSYGKNDPFDKASVLTIIVSSFLQLIPSIRLSLGRAITDPLNNKLELSYIVTGLLFFITSNYPLMYLKNKMRDKWLVSKGLISFFESIFFPHSHIIKALYDANKTRLVCGVIGYLVSQATYFYFRDYFSSFVFLPSKAYELLEKCSTYEYKNYKYVGSYDRYVLLGSNGSVRKSFDPTIDDKLVTAHLENAPAIPSAQGI